MWALAGAFAFLLFVAVIQSQATPIHPDLKKVLAQPQESPAQFPLARAGWDGPVQGASPNTSQNATLEKLSPAAAARESRAALRSAAVPDLRALAAIVLVILLLRRIRITHQKAQAAAMSAAEGKASVVLMPPPASDGSDRIERVA